MVIKALFFGLLAYLVQGSLRITNAMAKALFTVRLETMY